jgi:hypothetical protein
MDHPILTALLERVPMPSRFTVLSVADRKLLMRETWIAQLSTTIMGFRPDDALQPAMSEHHADPSNKNTRIFFFMGRPIARFNSQREYPSDAASTMWWASYYALCDYVGAGRYFIRNEERTNAFGLPLYELISFLLPCRRLWVFETTFESRSSLMLKYEIRIEEGQLQVTDWPEANRQLDPLRQHERSKTRQALLLNPSVEGEFYFVTKFSELARQPLGAGLSLQDLGLQENRAYAALSLRSADIEVTILTDARDTKAISCLERCRFLDLLQKSSRSLLERLDFIRHSEIIRSEVRHAIGQEHDKSEGWARNLHSIWLQSDRRTTEEAEEAETLVKLSEQLGYEKARINEVGTPAFDVFGVRKPARRRAASFSVFHGSRSEFEQLELVPFLERLIEPFKRDTSRDIGLSPNGMWPIVKTDHIALRACISELLTNADKYSASMYPVSVKISRSENEILLSIENVGPRLTLRERRFIQNYGFRGAAAIASGSSGTGGGLALVKDTATDLGLKFSYETSKYHEAEDDSAAALHVALVIFPLKCIISF